MTTMPTPNRPHGIPDVSPSAAGAVTALTDWAQSLRALVGYGLEARDAGNLPRAAKALRIIDNDIAGVERALTESGATDVGLALYGVVSALVGPGLVELAASAEPDD